MRLTCFLLQLGISEVVPAPLERACMNETPERHRSHLESFKPTYSTLADADTDLQTAYRRWRTGRGQFLDDIGARNPAAVEQRWQKHDFKGIMPSGEPGVPRVLPQYQTKLRTQIFVRAANDR
jgi:hypothetical protein